MKTRRLILSITTIIMLISLTGFPAGVHAELWERWAARYNSGGDGDDTVMSLAVDENANVYVVGQSQQNGEASSAVTVKYNASGIEQWCSVFEGSGPGADAWTDITIAADGVVYVTGSSAGALGGLDLVTMKYDGDGMEQWAAYYNGPVNGEDGATSIATDSDGNVYVTGYSEGSGSGLDYVTLKYDRSGNQIWTARYDGLAGGEDRANAMAVAGDGSVFITGCSAGIGTGLDYATVGYTPEGIEQWVTRYDGPGNAYDEARALALDDSGNVIVTGSSTGSWVYEDYGTVKYDSQGEELWAARYDGPGNWYDAAQAVLVDAAENIYVAGYSYAPFQDYDYATVKYNSSGTQLWIQRYNAPWNGDDRAYAMAGDDDANIYVTGYTSSYFFSHDYTTIKYDSDGTNLWQGVYSGPGEGEDGAVAIALDGIDGVHVAGNSQGEALDYDFATVKYSQNPPDLFFTLTANGPTILPASGGIIYYTIDGGNAGTYYEVADIWIDVSIPLGVVYGPVVGPVEGLSFPPGSSFERDRELTVPGVVPPGLYVINGYFGNYDLFDPVIYAEDHLEFTKLESGDETGSGGWFSDSGEPFTQPLPAVDGSSTPAVYGLRSNYPNPFNSRTTVPFHLQLPGCVQLSVFDISGRLLMVLVDGHREAGVHEVTFDAADLPSGVYLCRLQSETISTIRKLVLIK
jgi:hypothetical protein